MSGTIMEMKFDKNNITVDTDSNNNTVLKSSNIVSENRHQTKVFSSVVQKLVKSKQIQEYE